METLLYKKIREFSFFLVTCIARILPDLKPDNSELAFPAHSSPVTLPVNFDSLPDKFARRFFLKKKIEERRLLFFKNVYVNGDAVIFKNLRIYRPSLAWQPYIKWYTSGRFLVRQWLFKVNKVESDEPVALVYNQWGYENYYHWVIESLPRLLLIQKSFPDCLLIIPDPAPEFVKTTITLLGFKRFVPLHITDMTILKINNLVMPSLEFEQAQEYITKRSKKNYSQNHSPEKNEEELIITVKKQILSHFKPQRPGKKIFVSRSRQKFRRLINEKDLEPVLAKNGFEIVYFEGMPFNEQVKLMQETELLLSTHGANLVNLLFLPPIAIVIEMVNIDFTNDVYYTLASDLKLPYYAIPCTMIDTTLIPPKDVMILNDTANFTDQMVALNIAHLQVDVSLVEETIERALMHYSTKDA